MTTKHLSLLSLCIIALGCFSCSRKVDCTRCQLSFRASGFDSIALVNGRVEYYATPSFDRMTGSAALTPHEMKLVDMDTPSKGYVARMFTPVEGVNYKFRIGSSITTFSDFYYDHESEDQGWGMGEIDPCWATIHYMLNGQQYSQRPTSGVSIYITK